MEEPQGSQQSVAIPPALCLPIELVERILDFLHDDLLSLTSCRLTCQSWDALIAPYIFYELRLTEETAEFLSFLDTKPYLALLVRCFVVAFDEGPTPLLLNTLVAIAPLLINVVFLLIREVQFPDLDTPSKTSLLHSFPSLRRLQVLQSNFSDFGEFSEVVLAYPYITSFEASDNGLVTELPDELPDSIPSRMLPLDRVSIGYSMIPLMYAFIMRHSTLHFRSLRLYPVYPVHVVSVSTLFRSLGESLEDLQVAVPSSLETDFEEISVGSVPSLELNTGLRSLYVLWVMLDDVYDNSRHMLQLLSTIVSPGLESLAIAFKCLSLDELELKLNWTSLVEILSRSAFDNLRIIIFNVHVGPLYRTHTTFDEGAATALLVEELVREKMKALDSRDLQWRFVEDDSVYL